MLKNNNVKIYDYGQIPQQLFIDEIKTLPIWIGIEDVVVKKLKVLDSLEIAKHSTISVEDLTLDSLELTSLTIGGHTISSSSAVFDFNNANPDLFKIYADGTNPAIVMGGEVDNFSSITLYEFGGASADDYCTIKVEENGETTFLTHDNSGTLAHLNFDIDGNINIDAGISKNIVFKQNGTEIARMGEIGLIYQDNKGTSFNYADLDKIYGDGSHIVVAKDDSDIWAWYDDHVRSETPIKIREAASAVSNTAAFGQLWVKTATPNELYFQTDAGDDIQLTSGTSVAGGGGGTAKHWMDWYYYFAALSTQNMFYSEKHHDEYGVSSSIHTDLSTSGYSTTTLNNAWRMIRYSRRVPYGGTISKFMAHVEGTGVAADTDVEVALWWADALADDTEHASTANFTCAHLCTLTFDFSLTSRHMTKQTTSFNATSISEGDWLFITLRKTTSGDGTWINCHSTVLWDGS